MIALARYNAHKRGTLDRLTAQYQWRMRLLLKQNAEKNVKDILEALDAGHRSFRPDVSNLKNKIDDVLGDHRNQVIHVGISDGIQEVTPERVTNLWLTHPINMPVELTLKSDQAKKRDQLAGKLSSDWAKTHPDKVPLLASTLLDDYLTAVKKSFKILSSDWAKGEGSIADVKTLLSEALQVSASSSERIFRTETTNYFNESRHTYFATNTDVDFMELFAITDGRISVICADRHGAIVPISIAGQRLYMPAFHPNCRTIQRPLMSFISRDKADIIRFAGSIDESTVFSALQIAQTHWTPAVF